MKGLKSKEASQAEVHYDRQPARITDFLAGAVLYQVWI